MSRFALQKCSNLAHTLLANLLIARVIRWHGSISRNLNRRTVKKKIKILGRVFKNHLIIKKINYGQLIRN